MSDRRRSRALIFLSFLLAAALASEQAWAKGRGGGGKGGGKSRASFSGKRGGGHSAYQTTRGKGHGGKYSGQQSKGHGGGHSAYQTTHGKGHGAVKRTDSQVGKGRQPRATSGGQRDLERNKSWDKGSHGTADSAEQGSHRWSKQQANEERQRDHRRATADRLKEIAQRTGNARLEDTANRMYDKAEQRYEKRMAKIKSNDLLPDVPDGDDWVDDGLIDVDDPISDVGDFVPPGDEVLPPPDVDLPGDDSPFGHEAVEKLTGRENALYRQIRNEERKLARRMQDVERLWDAYDATGDEPLGEAADLLRQRALDHYAKRMEAIRSFQQRHGLPEPFGGEWSWPDIEPGLPGDPIDGVDDAVDVLIETVR